MVYRPRICAGLFVALLGSVPGWAQRATVSDRPLSERRVAYDIAVTLDPQKRTLRGTQTLTWRNPDRVPVDELQFHLYLNAFKNEKSTFMRESGGQLRGDTAEGNDRWGWIDIERLRVAAGPAAQADLKPRLRFIRPDDNNRDDQTVVAIRLPQPVPPQGTITLDIGFAATLPRIFARTGWEEKPNKRLFFLVGQWFPKLGVYEIPGQRYVPRDAPRGRWNTHQFHANSEFYADYGTFRVRITTPKSYLVGASGVRVGEQQNGGQQTLTYRADDVHDFAWTASNDFREFHDRWRHVDLRLLVQPEHADQAARHFAAAKIGLQYFNDWYGPYPYTTLTLVDGLGGSNGMEYPTLITCGTFYRLPRGLRALELVTIHEFGHQYWYGLVGSNEFEEAWLDEGINSYSEVRILDAVYGPHRSVLDLFGLHIGDGALQRVGYTHDAPTRGAIFARAWEYPFDDYGKNSYSKPATVLATLERHLGAPIMDRVLRTYFERWRFRHPTTRDFIQVAEEVSGRSLDWFFDPYVYGTVAVDYAVARIVNQELSPHREGVYEARAGGRFRIEEDGARRDLASDRELQKAPPELPADAARYKSEVWIERRQAGVFPQTLRVRFSDGQTVNTQFDGKETWKQFVFERPARVVEAYLDPDNRVLLDIDRLNNRKTVEPDASLATRYGLKWFVWLQQLFWAV